MYRLVPPRTGVRALTAAGKVKNGASLLRRSASPSLSKSHARRSLSFSRLPPATGLYSPKEERENCGVGMIAHLKRKPSRAIVEEADMMLVRMSHRGGTGCDPCSGDGAGMLVTLPHEFLQKVAKQDIGITLPSPGAFGVGNVFFPKSDQAVEEGKAVFEAVAKRYGLSVLGWRRLPTNNSVLGESSKASEPFVEQVFVENSRGLSEQDFERELFLIRRVAQNECMESAAAKEMYMCSLSCKTITYKGQLTPEQVSQYYLDLQDPMFSCYVALVHSRFSTNTFPSWDRAQPNRIMCHNGEINTLRGNKNWMFSRGALLESEYFGDETQRFLPVCSDNMSDSGNFDSVLELIVKASDRTLPEAMMMMIPEAWQNHQHMDDDIKAMYEYNSCMMEPWDGPAMMAFTDGNYIGATLDRNGLRPSRYYVTHDDHVILSSEVGVLPELEESKIKIKHRLEPGKMFLVDFVKGEIVNDAVVKKETATSRPFVEWRKNLTRLSDWVEHAKGGKKGKAALAESSLVEKRGYLEQTNRRLNIFGYTTETLDLLILPMAIEGKEALGSMGNDAALAVLSEQPKLPFDYFKQLFAQVTNPPIDPIREDLVMTLMCPVGPEGNLLRPGGGHAQRLVIDHPVISTEEMEIIKNTEFKQWKSKTLDATFPAHSGPESLVRALEQLCEEASSAIAGARERGEEGVPIIVLSDKLAGPDRFPIPSLLAVGAVHQHLIRTQQRAKAAILCEAGDAREVHDLCTLVGFGADGVCPHLAYEAISKLYADGMVAARGGGALSEKELKENYRKALGKGILKVMSKMGISTLQSYKGAQVFEAVGLADDVMDLCFTGTTSRLEGANFEALYTDIARMHEAAYPIHSNEVPLLPNPGNFHFRNKGEEHFNTPGSMVALQQAARTNSRAAYKQYSELSNKQAEKVSFRGLLRFKTDPARSIPLEEVEPVQEIVKRFVTGAMSLGSISKETHETLARAMNKLGGRSNTGEGGEDVERFYDDRRSAIKQVASGRFGVTSNYLAHSDQIQIKMAQGAKPGEGGELPGHKVSPYIGSLRHTTPGVGLISPPPHHDIYSIEDLAQLIHDLKNANPKGTVSVKLVSEVGVGVVAAGVAKAKSDHITISGGDGGTGAAAWTGIKGAGLPWELGIAEAQQTLVLNNLRSRVRLQADGQIKTGRDVVIAALLGAEEFGFSTAPLIALGCIMMRKCHLNTCPVGIATQDEELRKKFTGQPEHVINFFWLLAEEVREIMAELGFRKMDDMVGRADMLEVDPAKLHYKSKGLDLSPLLVPAASLNEEAGARKLQEQDHEIDRALDNKLIELATPALESKEKVEISVPITNLNRTCGTMLSYEISTRYGEEGLPDDTIHVKLEGHGGQSLGFALAKGVFLELQGDSNDYVGKSLSGGKIAVYPPSSLLDTGFVPEDNVIIGNVALYGGTRGAAYFRGRAGERFAVRNSGVKTVVEGVGDHGCEYMTGGRVVVLGRTGRNFAAGMSGGVAYIYDPNGEFPSRCNPGMVGLESVEKGSEAEEELKSMIEEHVAHTSSTVGREILSDWDRELKYFVQVMPYDYKKILLAKRANGEEAQAAVA